MAENSTNKDADKTGQPDVDILDLFLYAPIGLLYEYQEIIPKLVKRGKSQVQVGMFLGKMAAAKGQKEAEKQAGDALSMFAAVAAKGITEIGQAIGLAPPDGSSPGQGDRPAKTAVEPAAIRASEDPEPAPDTARLPIAGYDELTAREIVGMLAELNAKQRDRVRTHESENRNRKTVLSKLDALDKAK